MEKPLTSLQESLDLKSLTRSYKTVENAFEELAGRNFLSVIFDLLEFFAQDESFFVADVGCGSGTTIEGLVLFIKKFFPRRKILGIGIDQNPLSHLISPDLLSYKSFLHRWLKRSPFFNTKFLFGDATHLPLQNESIHFGYNVATMIYISDALRVMEEAYRVLKFGGVFYFEIFHEDISSFPSFDEILDRTPGAREIFEYIPSIITPEDQGFLILKKKPGIKFTGFPYKFTGSVQLASGWNPGPFQAFFRSAVYECVSSSD